MSMSLEASFLLAVRQAEEARQEWERRSEQNPGNREYEYGTVAWWEAVDSLASFAGQADRGLAKMPAAMRRALSNLSSSLARYDSLTEEREVPVPHQLVADVIELYRWYQELPQLHTQPVVIESVKAMSRRGDTPTDIARAWQCYTADGSLDTARVEREIDDPGSEEFFRRHPQQVLRDKAREEWLEYFDPIREELDAVAPDTSRLSLPEMFDAGVSVEDAAQVHNLDVATVELVYDGLRARQGASEEKPATPSPKPVKRSTKKRSAAKKPGGMTDDELRAKADELGIGYGDPLDRETLQAQIESLVTS